MQLTIYTDGASRGNPGLASYGFVIQDEKGKTLFEKGQYLGIATNNFAEYSGILASLEHVKKVFENPREISINFLMDSKLAVEQLSGRFKVKNSAIKEFFTKITLLAGNFKKVSYKHIPREQNFQADKQANIALDVLLQKR